PRNRMIMKSIRAGAYRGKRQFDKALSDLGQYLRLHRSTAGFELGSKGSVPHLASRAFEAPSPSASPSGVRLKAWNRISQASGKPLPSRSCPVGQAWPANSGL